MSKLYRNLATPKNQKRSSTSILMPLLLSLLFALVPLHQSKAQITLTTEAGLFYTGANGVAGSSAITFVLENTTSTPVFITGVDVYWQAVDNNGTIPTLWYSATDVSGLPSNIAANWTSIVTSNAMNIPADGYYPTFIGMNFILPGDTTYRFAVESTNGIRYSGTAGPPSPNSFSVSGVSLHVYDYQIDSLNVGYGGSLSSPSNNPRAFTGRVHFMPVTPCTDPPVAGAASSVSITCPGQSFNLAVIGAVLGTGQTYQWQSSTDSIIWNNIPGATTLSYTHTQTTANWYRLQVTCTQTSSSDPVFVDHLSGGLAGNVTVNQNAPSSPTNFTSFAALLNRLSCVGISGPLTVNVVAGTGPYTERVVLGPVNGMSAVNTITINGNGEVLQYDNSSSERAVIQMDGAKHFIIDNIAITTLNSLYGWGIHFFNESDSNIVRNCTIDISSVTSTTAANSTGIGSSGSLTSLVTTGNGGNYNLIEGNAILGSSSGGSYQAVVFIGGTGAAMLQGNIIRNNTISNFHLWGIRITSSVNTIVEGNTISRADRATTGIIRAIYMTGTNEGAIIRNNRISHLNTAVTNTSTIYFIDNSSGGTQANPINIYNNLLHNADGGGLQYGLHNAAAWSNYYHNTIVLDDSDPVSSTTYGFYTNTASNDNLNVFNNIFYMARNTSSTLNYAIRVNTATVQNFASNNNVFYLANGAGVGYRTSGYATLAAWTIGTGDDAASIEADPIFSNLPFGDLTINNIAINNMGMNLLSVVATDFNGDPRTSTPDPGAYEYTPILGVDPTLTPSANFITQTICPGIPSPVEVVLSNLGQTVLTQATIGWTVNGIAQIPYVWSGALSFAMDTVIVIGNYTFTSGTPSQVVAYISGSVPTVLEPKPENDSATYEVIAAISGTFTINSANPTGGSNFNNLEDFATAINAAGICGPITVDVVAGSGPYTSGIELGPIAGTSTVNTVTITGNNNVVNEGTAPFFIAMNGVSHVTITGFQFINTNPSTNMFGLMFRGGCQHINITNNLIDVGTEYTSSLSGGILASGSTTSATTAGNNAQYLNITGNTIIGGYYGITLVGNSSYQDNYGHIVSNNVLSDYYLYGIYMVNADTIVVEGNDLSRPSRTTLSTFYGVYLSSSRNVKIRNNRIHDSGIASYTAYPIYITTSVNSPGNETEIVNNLIYNIQSTGTIYGMYLLGTRDYMKIYHNTVDLSLLNSTGTVRGIFMSTAPNNHDFKNNIISLHGDGTGTKHLIYISTGSATYTANNNVYYAEPTSGTNNFGWFDSLQATFTIWQTATGRDANSMEAPPLYANSLAGAMIPLSPVIDNMGTPVGVLTDIEGDPRSITTPDVGAIEFTGLNADLNLAYGELVRGECLTNNDTVRLYVVNTIGGPVNLAVDSIVVNWNVSGPMQSSGTIVLNSGALLPGDTVVLMSTGVDMSVVGLYELNASMAPSNANESPFNDTIMPSILEVRPNFTAWSTVDTLTSDTATTELRASSIFFPSGQFFMTEICHFKTGVGEPIGGWPPYLIADDYIEITGVPGSDMGGIVLEQWDGTTMLSTYTFPQGTQLSPAGTAVIAVGQLSTSVPVPSSFYYHGNGAYTGTFGSTIVAGRILKDQGGNIIDAVGYGTYTFPAAAGVTPAHWTGNTPALSSSGNRLEGAYTKDATNWINSGISPQDPNTLNASVTLPAPPPNLTGFTWSVNGIVIDTVSVITVGNFNLPGTYEFVATFISPCGILTDTVTLVVDFPYCYEPTGLAADPSCTEADLMWTSGPYAMGTGIEYGPTGYIPGTGTLVIDVHSPHTISGLTPGTGYDFYVIDSCTGLGLSPLAGPFNFSTLPLPTVSLGSTISYCAGDPFSETLDAGHAGATYMWSTGATTQTITVNAAGTYWVAVDAGGGCLVADTVTVIEHPVPVVDIGQDTATHVGALVSLDAGNPGATYLWSTGATTQTIDVDVHGTYSVTVTDANGCEGSASIKIDPNSINTIDGIGTWSVFPNPTIGDVHIALELLRGGHLDIVLYDPSGRRVWEQSYSNATGTETISIPMQGLAQGMYLLRVRLDGQLIGTSAVGRF